MKHTYIPKPSELYSLRSSVRITQNLAASLVNATVNTWSRWETGKDEMPPDRWRLFTLEVGLIASEMQELTKPKTKAELKEEEERRKAKEKADLDAFAKEFWEEWNKPIERPDGYEQDWER